MISNIELTAVNETGILGKIAIALIKKGYKIVGQSISNDDNQDFCLIKFGLETNHEIVKGEIEHLKTTIPQIVKIHDQAENGSGANETDINVNELLKNYGKQLIGEYPNISHLLKKIDNELAPSIKQEMLTKLGKGLGRWQCKNNYSLGGLLSLDKTLQRMVWPSLKDFLTIDAKGTFVEVHDCPHCFNQVDSKPSCFFIAGFIEGFLDSLNHLPLTSVAQIHSKAMGHKHCSFEVRSASK